MDGKDGNFPTFNFPYVVDGNVNESYVDYGSSSDLNVDVDDAGGLIFQGKLPYRIDKPRWSVTSRQPSTPFLSPNERSPIPDETIEDLRSKGGGHTSGSVRHSRNCYSDFPDVMFGGSLQLIHEELDDSPWNCCPRLSLNSASFSDFFNHVCWLCKPVFRQGLEKVHDRSFIKRYKWLEDLSSDVADIHPDLMETLLKESYEEKVGQLEYDTTQGNVLACMVTESGRGCVLLHPSGPSLEILNVSSCNCADRGLDLELGQQFSINGSIKQLACGSVVQGQLLAAARSQYQVSFFQGSFQPKLQPLESVACTSQTTSVALSPYIPNEAVVAMESGSVHLWTCGSAFQMVHQPDDQLKQQKLNECVYASNPRCIVLADTVEAGLIDFRAGSCSQTTLFSIPSTHVKSFEVISALQRHPQNPHHYFVATDLSILLLDDRFAQHPVLKWHHHLQDVPQFMDIVCGAPPEENILMISGSRHRETHCYQFSDQDGRLPPRSASLPWKVSPYNDWLSNLDNWPVSPAVNDRVTKPLIGTSTVPHSVTNGFTVLTMSSVGDLFHQPFVVDYDNKMIDKTSSGGCGSESVQLDSKLTTACMEWINAVCEEADELQLGQPYSKHLFEFDMDTAFEEMTSMETPCAACSFCSNPSGESNPFEDTSCPRCGLKISYSQGLLKLQQTNNIITNKSLSANVSLDDLVIFKNPEDSKDPLSTNLLRNWTSDKPTPINLTGKEPDGDTSNQNDVEPGFEPCPAETQDVKAVAASGRQETVLHGMDTKNANIVHSQEVFGSPTKRAKKEKKRTAHMMGF